MKKIIFLQNIQDLFQNFVLIMLQLLTYFYFTDQFELLVQLHRQGSITTYC